MFIIKFDTHLKSESIWCKNESRMFCEISVVPSYGGWSNVIDHSNGLSGV